MTKPNKQDKLAGVTASNSNNNNNNRRKGTPRVTVDSKIRDKFFSKLNKINKTLDRKDQISKSQAATAALKLWMEKNNV